jgi:hypothetical protein
MGFLQKTKSGTETLHNFKDYKAAMEKWTGQSIKTVHSDNGTEFLNHEFETFCRTHGITRTMSTPYVHEQNGIAERKNRTIFSLTLTMLLAAGAPLSLWGEACMAAIYIFNRVPTPRNSWTSAYEIISCRSPSYDHLRVWGCKAVVHNYLAPKMHPKGTVGRFVGYDSHSKAFRVLIGTKVVVSRDVSFFEDDFSFTDTVSPSSRTFPDYADDFDWSDDPPIPVAPVGGVTAPGSSDSETPETTSSQSTAESQGQPSSSTSSYNVPPAPVAQRFANFRGAPMRQPNFEPAPAPSDSAPRPSRNAARDATAKMRVQWEDEHPRANRDHLESRQQPIISDPESPFEEPISANLTSTSDDVTNLDNQLEANFSSQQPDDNNSPPITQLDLPRTGYSL